MSLEMEIFIGTIITASAALLGLTAIFIVQLRLSGLESVKNRLSKSDYDNSKWLLFLSACFGFLSIIFGIISYSVHLCSKSVHNCLIPLISIAAILMILQLIFLFSEIVLIFSPFSKSPRKKILPIGMKIKSKKDNTKIGLITQYLADENGDLQEYLIDKTSNIDKIDLDDAEII